MGPSPSGRYFKNPKTFDYTAPGPATRAGVEAAKRHFAKTGLSDTGTYKAARGISRSLWQGLVGAHNAVTATMDGRLRRMTNTTGESIRSMSVLASQFWRAPGDDTVLRAMLVDDEVNPSVKAIISATLNGDTLGRRVNANRSRLFTEVQTLFKGMSDADIETLLQEAYATEVDKLPKFSNEAQGKQFRKLMDLAYEMAREAGLPIDKRAFYVPFTFDREAMVEGKDELMTLIYESGLVRRKQNESDASLRTRGEEYFQSLLEVNSPVPLEMHNEHQGSGMEARQFERTRAAGHGFTNQRKLWEALTNPEHRKTLNKFRQKNGKLLMQEYLNQVAKSAAFNDIFGSAARKVERLDENGVPYFDANGHPIREWSWDPLGKFGVIWAEATREGMSTPQAHEVHDMMNAYMGRVGQSFSPETRKLFGGIMLYQNVRLLLFATLASLQDILGPMIRTGSPLKVLKSYKDYVTKLSKEERHKLRTLARTYGMVNDEVNDHILSQEYDNHYTNHFTSKMNDRFFRAIGMKKWTDFTRTLAVKVSREMLIDNAHGAKNGNKRSQRMLKELGIEPELVERWVRDGELAYGIPGISREDVATKSLRDGITPQMLRDAEVISAVFRRLNDEMILRPTPALRPEWASNPAWMLVWHLKSFIFTFQKTYMSRIWHEMNASEATGYEVAKVVTAALLMLPVAALGLELRELLQYDLPALAGATVTSPFDRMTGMEYLFEVMQRSGALGLTQFMVDYDEANERGRLGAMALMGPTASQLEELVTKSPSQSIPRSVPIASQVPGLREALRGALFGDE